MITLPLRPRVSPGCRKSFLQKLHSRHSAGAVSQTGPDVLPRRGAPKTRALPLDLMRNMEQPRLLLIVPEHAYRCGYSRCRGFRASVYGSEADFDASDAKVDGDEVLYLPCLYRYLRSDVNTGFGHIWLSEVLNLMTSVLAAWAL